MSVTTSYCRFCANEKPHQSLINLQKTNKLQNFVKDKLRIFSEEIIDFSKKYLPENICTACYSILNKCHEFFVHAKESQVVLSILCNEQNTDPVNADALPTVAVKQEFSNLELDSWIDEIDAPDDSWSSYPWYCHLCELVMPYMQELRAHNQEYHGACYGFRCGDCNEQTVGFDAFVEHVRVHRPALRNYCQYCNIKIETPAHVDTHTYNCNSCGQPFNLKKHLLAHLQKYKPIMSKNSEEKLLRICNKNVKLEKVLLYTDTKAVISSNLSGDNDGVAYDIPLPPLYDTTLKRNIELVDLKSNYQNIRVNTINVPSLTGFRNIITKNAPSLTKFRNISTKIVQSRTKMQNINAKNLLNLTKFQNISTENVPTLVPISKKVSKTERNIKIEINDNVDKLSNTVDIWSDYPCICKFCGISVANWGILKIHCLSHHKKCFGMKCIDCENDESHTWELFAQHVIKHRPNLLNHCHYCHTPISDSDQFYNLHLQTHKARFQCSACGQQFKGMRDFRLHDNKLEPHLLKPPNKRNSSPIQDKDVVCNICYFRAKNPWFLKKHKIIHSDRKRDFTCERCGKSFISKGSLGYHTKMHELHEGEPKEICKVCSKAFYTVNKLRDHVKCHNLVMPFQCDDCKKYFRSKNSLRSHVIIHTDFKPFACQYCPKRFNRKKLMQNHEYQHTGARPFSCDLCCLNFTCWSNCDKHLRRIHGMSLAKGIITPYGKIDINPETGKPRELSITSDLKEWTKSIIDAKNKSGRKKREVEVEVSQKCNM